MLKEIFPSAIYERFKKVNMEQVTEIRLRVGCAIAVHTDKIQYLSHSGLVDDESQAIVVHSRLIEDILQLVSHNSLYAINDQLIDGYVSVNGIRIGVAGELVMVNGEIKTLKNITSLNIRIPHVVKNCSLPVFNYLVNNQVLNTLIISPPGAGKTTFLRDLIYQLKQRRAELNMLIVDERNEITSPLQRDMLLGVDVYKNCSKEYAFSNGIRSMKPHVILTDEINLHSDIEAIENAITSGVKVVATIHANGIDDLKNKNQFASILKKQLFDRFVVLGFSNGVGTIEGVYNASMRCIFI